MKECVINVMGIQKLLICFANFSLEIKRDKKQWKKAKQNKED